MNFSNKLEKDVYVSTICLSDLYSIQIRGYGGIQCDNGETLSFDEEASNDEVFNTLFEFWQKKL